FPYTTLFRSGLSRSSERPPRRFQQLSENVTQVFRGRRWRACAISSFTSISASIDRCSGRQLRRTSLRCEMRLRGPWLRRSEGGRREAEALPCRLPLPLEVRSQVAVATPPAASPGGFPPSFRSLHSSLVTRCSLLITADHPSLITHH